MIRFAIRNRCGIAAAAFVAALLIASHCLLWPLTPSALRHSQSMRFVFGEGSWRRGFDIVVVESGGKCTYYCWQPSTGGEASQRRGGIYKKCEFYLEDSVFLELRSYLADNDFPNWHSCDSDLCAFDGDTSIVIVTCGNSCKRISAKCGCSANVESMSAFIRERIIARNLSKLKHSVEIGDDAMLQAHNLLK
jgi:hypothetical protein